MLVMMMDQLLLQGHDSSRKNPRQTSTSGTSREQPP
jgi:hypothetical protein